MKITRSIISAIIVILIVGLLTGCSFRGINFMRYTYPDEEKYTVGDTVIQTDITDVDVDWPCGKVEIVPADTDAISVTEICEDNIELTDSVRLHWLMDGMTLKIKYAGSSSERKMFPIKKLIITLPERICLSALKVDATSADIEVNGIKTKTAMLSSTSGSITGEIENTDKAALSSTSGRINVKLGEADEIISNTTSGSLKIIFDKAENVKADSTSGHISLEGSVFGNLCAETVSGGIGAKIKGKTASIELESTSGDITCIAESSEKLKASSTSGDVDLKAGRADNVNAESTSGSINLSFDVAPEKIDAESTSGTIKLFLPEDAGFTAEVSTASGDFDSDFALWKNKNKYKANDGSAEFELETTSGNIKIKIK